MSRRGPLAGSYPAAVALVVLALVPFLLVAAAVLPLGDSMAKSLGMSQGAFDLTVALADGAYAFGTVLAVQLATHLPARRLLLVYLVLFVGSSVASASAPSGDVFAPAFVVEGLCTSLMLIAAVPPLVAAWPARKMPVTAAVMNLCIFGAVAAGPSVGALEAAAQLWRPLFWAVAGLAALALLVGVLNFEDDPPADRGAPWDVVAQSLAAVGCATAFIGAGLLEAVKHATPAALTLAIVGVAAVTTLIVHQHRTSEPLMPVRQAATTFPVTGILLAMLASAAGFGLMALLLIGLKTAEPPGRTAILFLPELGGAVVMAAVFGLLFRTRFTPVLAIAGAVVLAAGAATSAVAVAGRDEALVAVSTGLIGLGVGASVSPALFMAGLSLRSAQIQRIFALIELLRGVTAFMLAPVLVFLAGVIAVSHSLGIETACYICLGLAAAGAVLAVVVFVLGGGRLQVPDLDRWTDDGEPAWDSPPLWSALRSPAVLRAVGDGGADTRSATRRKAG